MRSASRKHCALRCPSPQGAPRRGAASQDEEQQRRRAASQDEGQQRRRAASRARQPNYAEYQRASSRRCQTRVLLSGQLMGMA